jgi:hypothetical protein
MTAFPARRPSALLCLRCLKTLQPGDTLMVWKLDRQRRSLRDPITMLDDLKQRRGARAASIPLLVRSITSRRSNSSRAAKT